MNAPKIKDYVRGKKVVKSDKEKIVGIKAIEHVGNQIFTDRSTMFLLKNINTDVVPRIGDIVVFYTILCTEVVGVELNGKLLYFH
ncbi:MAG: hypothetical protein E7012_01050 [Alphaproteobacteria bacterium]|nr:hypothetical protein [Alphaproteobacteria bacterium]